MPRQSSGCGEVSRGERALHNCVGGGSLRTLPSVGDSVLTRFGEALLWLHSGTCIAKMVQRMTSGKPRLEKSHSQLFKIRSHFWAQQQRARKKQATKRTSLKIIHEIILFIFCIDATQFYSSVVNKLFAGKAARWLSSSPNWAPIFFCCEL